MPGDMKNRMSGERPRRNYSGLLWLFAGLSIGLFVAFLTYLKTQPKSDVSFSEAVTQEIKKAKQHKEEKRKNQTNTQAGDSDKTVPKFDFYTILKDYEVFVPESEVSSDSDKPTSDNRNSEPVKKDLKKYFLQVGSFQRLADADKRRATLALLGISSSIQEAQINNDTWYRVKVGPIEGKRSLNKVRDQLIDNDIPTLIMVMK